MIRYRSMTDNDVVAAVKLCRDAGWNQTEAEWKFFLARPDGVCQVAERDGDVVGSFTVLPFGDSFSWISMVLVRSDARKQGIGMGLLQRALNQRSVGNTMKLDATPAGRAVYLKLGFTDEYELSRMQAAQPKQWPFPASVRTMQAADLESIIDYDRPIFGADRSPLLHWLWQQLPQAAFVIERDGDVQGYCLVRRGEGFCQIGPLVANDAALARHLFAAALAHRPQPEVVVDAGHHDPSWLSWLRDSGFTIQRSFTRMNNRSLAYSGIPEKQFAIAGPEFG